MLPSETFSPPVSLAPRLAVYLSILTDTEKQELLDTFLDAVDYCPRQNTRTATATRAALILRWFRELVILRGSLQVSQAGLYRDANAVRYYRLGEFAFTYRLAGLDFARWAHSECFDLEQWRAENLPTSWQRDAAVNKGGIE